MQNMVAFDALRNAPYAAPQQSAWLAYARALTFTVWFFSLVVNYWWRQEWNDLYEMLSAGVDVKSYYYVGIAVAFVGHLTLGPVKWVEAIFRLLSSPVGKVFTAFFLFMFVLTPLSVTPTTSAKYLLATFGVFILCSLFWVSDYHVLRRALVFTGMVLFAWMVLLLVHHGMPRGFGATIGGINRNMIGKLGLVAMTCVLFANHKALRWAAIGVAAAFFVLVTSRGSMLAFSVLLAVYYTSYKGTAKAVGYAAVGVFLVGAALLASHFIQQAVLQDVLRVNDERRGFGTDFTGRVENWKQGLETFRKRPLVGYGFRATVGVNSPVSAAHSGYINLLLESGVIGTCLIIGAVLVALYHRMRIILKIRPLVERDGAYRTLFMDTFRLNAIAAGTLCAVGTLWIYEPLYINLGQVASILFFLMVTAPMYVNVAPQAARLLR